MFKILISLILFSFSSTADDCKLAYDIFAGSKAFTILGNNPIEQLYIFETTENTLRYRKTTEIIDIRYALVESEELFVRTLPGSEGLQKLLIQGDHVAWVRHPLGSSSNQPFVLYTGRGKIPGRFSASRSMFVTVDEGLFTFKLPTTKPHPNAPSQPGKDKLRNDTIISINRSIHIRAVDEKIGKSENFEVLTEVMSVSDKLTGNGYSIRDLRPLQDGNYYLPGFSIPYVGKKIAEHLKTDFTSLWGEAYAAAIGSAKALLLLRYGLQMKYPNAQNWLIQLDQNLKPTGKVFLRDVADSNYVNHFAQVVAPKQLVADMEERFNVFKSIQPNFQNSMFQMDEGGLSNITYKAWEVLHEKAMLKTLRDGLGLDKTFKSIEQIDEFIKTAEGQKILLQAQN